MYVCILQTTHQACALCNNSNNSYFFPVCHMIKTKNHRRVLSIAIAIYQYFSVCKLIKHTYTVQTKAQACAALYE